MSTYGPSMRNSPHIVTCSGPRLNTIPASIVLLGSHQNSHARRAAPGQSNPRPAVSVVVDQPPAVDQLRFNSYIGSSGAEADSVVENTSVVQSEFDLRAAGDDRGSRGRVRLAAPFTGLSDASEDDGVAVRGVVQEVGRWAGVF